MLVFDSKNSHVTSFVNLALKPYLIKRLSKISFLFRSKLNSLPPDIRESIARIVIVVQIINEALFHAPILRRIWHVVKHGF